MFFIEYLYSVEVRNYVITSYLPIKMLIFVYNLNDSILFPYKINKKITSFQMIIVGKKIMIFVPPHLFWNLINVG